MSTFTFCTIPDPDAAAREAYRVLVPGGRFVLAEHGPPDSRVGRAVVRWVEPLALRLSADHLTRDPVPDVERAGFRIDEVRRSGFGRAGFQVLARKPVSP